MKVNSRQTKSKALAIIIGQMEDPTREIGPITKWMVMAYLFGKMANSMKGIL